MGQENAGRDFAKRLTTLMGERRMSVRAAAKVAKVNVSTVVSWRGGRVPRDFVAAQRLARALQSTLSYLLTGEDETRPQGAVPSVSEVFKDGGDLFNGYAQIVIRRLIPRGEKIGDEQVPSGEEK